MQQIEGVVKWFNDMKGYGFLQCQDGDVFVHCSAVQTPGRPTLAVGQHVKSQIVEGPKGLRAKNVHVIQ